MSSQEPRQYPEAGAPAPSFNGKNPVGQSSENANGQQHTRNEDRAENSGMISVNRIGRAENSGQRRTQEPGSSRPESVNGPLGRPAK